MRMVAWLFAALALGGLWATWGLAPVDRSVPGPREVAREASTGGVDGRPIPVDSLAGRIIAENPFRRDRRPPPMRLTEYEERPPRPAAPVHKPRLRLTGLIGGTRPSAVIDGVPGVSGGAVMMPGDTLHGLVLEAIVGDTVLVIGADTTWVLVLRRSSE